MRSLWIVVFIVQGLSSLAWAAEQTSLSSKISVRTGVGSLQNTGNEPGTTAANGGLDLDYLYFLNPRLAIGVGYAAQFDTSSGISPVAGLEILVRKYFMNDGTRVKTTDSWGSYESASTWSPYVLGLYGMRQFYLGPDIESSDPTKTLTGTYSVINVGVGVDHHLSGSLEWNAELSRSLIAFASSDPRVKISETMIWVGLNYVF